MIESGAARLGRRTVLKQLTAGALAASSLSGGPVFGAAPRKRSVLIRGGTIINAHGRQEADVLIVGETIEQIGPDLTPPTRTTRIIDARGLQLMPGGIDPHVHAMPGFVDDFESTSRAALAGGITTMGVMAFFNKGESLMHMLQRLSTDVRQQSMADVMLHPSLEGRPPTAQELPQLAEAGYTSLKLFSIDVDFHQAFPQYVEVLEASKKLGILPLLHCEDQNVNRAALKRLVSEGKTSIAYYEESRPVVGEELSTQHAAALCELTGCPIYIVHLSSARALRVCEAAQARGLPVYVEGRPIYLHHTSERYKGPDGPLYVSMPPIRSAADGEALWKGVAAGSIHTLGSDHAPYFKRDKLDPKHDITDPLAGSANLQEMLPVFYSEGVLKGRIGLERFVQVSSTHPAKLFGLYPRKGVIQAGSDADLNVWDPARKITMRAADAHSRVGFSIYEGWEATGAPRFTLRRGEFVCEEGRITAAPGSGVSLARDRWKPFEA
jgi:dihydropyrimidinase